MNYYAHKVPQILVIKSQLSNANQMYSSSNKALINEDNSSSLSSRDY